MRSIDIVVKQTEPLRVAVTSATAPGYGYQHINPVFEERLPGVWGHLEDHGARPGICVAFYEERPETDEVLVHLGFEIGDQSFDDSGEVRVENLPVVEVASTIHRGSMVDAVTSFEAMARWIEASGCRLAGGSRELYHRHEWPDTSGNATELQMPIAPRAT